MKLSLPWMPFHLGSVSPRLPRWTTATLLPRTSKTLKPARLNPLSPPDVSRITAVGKNVLPRRLNPRRDRPQASHGVGLGPQRDAQPAAVRPGHQQARTVLRRMFIEGVTPVELSRRGVRRSAGANSSRRRGCSAAGSASRRPSTPRSAGADRWCGRSSRPCRSAGPASPWRLP